LICIQKGNQPFLKQDFVAEIMCRRE